MTQTPALFFYGTLLDDDLFAAVLDAPKTSVTHRPARLADHFVSGISGLPYPMLERKTGSVANGIIVEGLSQQQFDRVRYYESIDYNLVEISVETDAGPRTAMIFVGTEDHQSDGAPWSIDVWRGATKALSIAVFAEISPLIGVEPIEVVDATWNAVEKRMISEGMANHAVAPWEIGPK